VAHLSGFDIAAAETCLFRVDGFKVKCTQELYNWRHYNCLRSSVEEQNKRECCSKRMRTVTSPEIWRK